MRALFQSTHFDSIYQYLTLQNGIDCALKLHTISSQIVELEREQMLLNFITVPFTVMTLLVEKKNHLYSGTLH